MQRNSKSPLKDCTDKIQHEKAQCKDEEKSKKIEPSSIKILHRTFMQSKIMQGNAMQNILK